VAMNPIYREIFSCLIDSTWQSFVLVTGVSILVTLLRLKHASIKHFVWASVLCDIFISPFVNFLLDHHIEGWINCVLGEGENASIPCGYQREITRRR
jgi:hypothetical protein